MKKNYILLLTILICFSLFAETKTALTGSRGWGTAGDWSPSGIPTTSDQVVIPSGSFMTVQESESTSQYGIESITVESGGYLFISYPLVVAGTTNASSNAGSITVSRNFTITDNDFTNTGSISVDAGDILWFKDTSSEVVNSGIITLNSDSSNFSSLIYQGTSWTQTGSLTYQRYISAASSAWDLIGSPVTGETASDIIAQTNLANSGSNFGIGEYDNSTGSLGTWNTFTALLAAIDGPLNQGYGYQMATDNGATVSFTGDLQIAALTNSVYITEGDDDGDTVAATGTRFNLLSNPFPAYININAAAAAASVAGSDYLLKTRNLNVLHDNNQGIYIWGGSSYTLINSATAAASAVLAPGQGFMVGGKYDDTQDYPGFTSSTTSFDFYTAMVTEDGDDDAISGDTMPTDRGELFISLTTGNDVNRTEIYFLENMTDGFDKAYDGETFGSQPIYTKLLENDFGINLAIQSLSFSEMNDKIIPLGIHANANDNVNISISHNTLPADLKIYLEDRQQGIFILLNNNDFLLNPMDNITEAGRFFIHTKDIEIDNTNIDLHVYKVINQDYITIEGLSRQPGDTRMGLYNILGVRVLDVNLNNSMNTQMISTDGFATGIYVVKLESGINNITKKLIIK